MALNSNVLSITVSNAVSQAANITLSASATTINAGNSVTFTGVVTNQSGAAMSGVNVLLTDSTTNASLSATTNANGAYTFTVAFPASGSYTIFASA